MRPDVFATAAPRGPAPAQPSPRARRAGQLLELLWRSRLARRPELTVDALVAAAHARTKLDLPADPAWRARLALLCHDLRVHARLNPLGEVIAYGQLVAAIADRMALEALWRRQPTIAAVPFDAPIIIVGQMRSGSTRMQRMLAYDSRLTFTRFYEAWNPVPRLPGQRFDDRRLRASLGLFATRLLTPEFGAIHPTWLDAPDEETGLFSPLLFGAAFEAQWRVPGFARHGETADRVPVYRALRRMLQTLAWLRGAPPARPWILKAPQYAQDLAAIAEVFPDARYIVLSRERGTTVASSASLMHNQMRLQSDVADPHWIGAEALRKVSLRDARIAAAALPAERRVDVDFEEMNADPAGAMRRVYAMLGLPLTPALAALHARHDARLAQTLARHRYRAADYGLATGS